MPQAVRPSLPLRVLLRALAVVSSRAQPQAMANLSEPRPQWRLILDSAQSGARNMATDEALARAQLEPQSQSRATLRFYAWEPSCLSLGRLQKLDGLLQVLATRRASLDWVRRPSGGRAVWHQAEVTYSFSLSLDHLPPEARSVVGAYEWLSRPLLRGLQSLGVRAEMASSKGEEKGERNCFLSSSQADAVVDGRKLIGGAQCRFEASGRTAILQHGSVLIELDAAHWLGSMGEESNSQSLQRLSERVVCLRDLGVQGSAREVRARVQQAIAQALSEEFEVEQAGLSAREMGLRDELEAGKYLQAGWNERGRL